MKLASYRTDEGPSFGAVVEGGIVDLRRALAGRYADLRDFLARGTLAEAAEALARARPVSAEGIEWLPVVPNPGKIWCCGLNYHAHVEECGTQPTGKPTFFLRTASSQVGHEGAILCPRESDQLDFEAEIAVVIGRPGRRIAPQDAAAHVAGYAIYNDASVRDWQLQTSQWDAGKNFWRTGGFGPWLVTADEIPFGTELTLVGRLNRDEVQRATTAMLIHDIAAQIAHVSVIAPLEPGDVIVTGTPGGIGAMRQPPLWMKAGDVFEVEVDRIGTLRNPVAAD